MERIIGKLIKIAQLSDKAKNINFDDDILHEHNHQPYINIVDTIEKDGKACAIHATGTGKMYLALKWLNDNLDKSFAYIAPSNVILNKFVDLLIEYLFPQDAEKLKLLPLDDEIEYLQTHLGINLHLYTYQKLNTMTDNEMKDLKIDCIVLDEFHRCGADKWGKSVERFLQIHSNAKLLGLSATPIRPSDGKNMVQELFDGKIASKITLRDAFEQGILPIPTMINAIYSFEEEIVSLQTRLYNYKFDPDKQKEIDKKLKEVKQLIGESGGIKEIFKQHLECLKRDNGKLNAKFIVFCKDIADRDAKMDECKLWFARGTKIKKYSATSKEKKFQNQKLLTQKVISNFENDKSNSVKLLFVVDMLNEGVHIKDLDGVVMLRDTNSNIVFLQQLGRALASGNSASHSPIIFDLVNNIEVLGEDIKEYREVIKSLTKNAPANQRDIHRYQFELQTQIIDILQYLKDILNNRFSFEEKLEVLTAYANQYGSIENIMVKEIYICNGIEYPIGNWIIIFRGAKEGNRRGERKLLATQIQELDKLGMKWNVNKITSFEDKIKILQAYASEHDGTIKSVVRGTKYSYNDIEYPLGIWLNDFRQKRASLSKEGIDVLDKLGMVWKIYQNMFNDKLKILQIYSNEHNGTLENIQENDVYVYEGIEYPVGKWISRFRINQGSQLKPIQIQQLESLGVSFENKRIKLNVTIFGKKIEVLTSYCREYNKTIANIKKSEKYLYNGEEYSIGEWIREFRKAKKGTSKSSITHYQITELEKLGMAWSVDDRKFLVFEDKIEILQAYASEHNGTLEYIRHKDTYVYNNEEYQIGGWITNFRLAKEGKSGLIPLTTNQIEKLEKLGIRWKAVNKRGCPKKLIDEEIKI